MKSRKLILFLILSISFACTSKKDKSTENYAVLEFNPEWNWIYKNVKSTELLQSDFLIIDKVLKQAVDKYNLGQVENIKERKKWFEETYPNQDFEKSEPKLTLDLKNYKMQYVPIINENGEKEVWINLFCTTEHTNWKEEIVVFYDGGNCFFNLKINLNKNSYADFQVNGNA